MGYYPSVKGGTSRKFVLSRIEIPRIKIFCKFSIAKSGKRILELYLCINLCFCSDFSRPTGARFYNLQRSIIVLPLISDVRFPIIRNYFTGPQSVGFPGLIETCVQFSMSICIKSRNSKRIDQAIIFESTHHII